MSESHLLEQRQAHLPDANGRPSIVQGRYGDRGNLELVFADPHDGLWVCWFNADDPLTATTGPGARAAEWSGGLHFAAGHTYHDVALIQANRGPNFLELIATSSTTIEHWTWTPQSGFVRRGLLPQVEPVSKPSICETPAGFVVAAVGASSIWRWSANVSGAAWGQWQVSEAHPLPNATTMAAVRVDPTGQTHTVAAFDDATITQTVDGRWTTPTTIDSNVAQVHDLDLLPGSHGAFVVATTDHGILAGRIDGLELLDDFAASAVCMARSRIDVERTEIVARGGSRLRHLRTTTSVRGDLVDTAARTIESKVHWPADAPIHRTS